MKSKSLLLTILISYFSFGQEYSADKIPEELLNNSDAVVRYSVGQFEIQSSDKAKYYEKAVITILNKDGNHNALISVYYDKLRSINSLSAFKYDANGDRISKSKTSNFYDRSMTSSGTFFDDNRIKVIDLRQEEFPYTIEYEYELSYKYLYSIPSWHFYSGTEESVEFSEFRLISPYGLEPRYRSINVEEPLFSQTSEKKTWSWKMENLKSQETEPYGPSFWEVTPHIIAAPSKFEYDGYQGDMSTWDGYAQWQNKLNEGREVLPEETILRIKSLTEGLEKRDKVRKVYEYLQSKTRYVSIQLGIGGLQPFPAKVVDEEGYGDCKALSFYTKSLLREVGIEANYTIVYGGDNPPQINKDFPSPSYFNHVILSVPMEEDTIWLECTSQTNPFNYLGSFTGNRDVFVVNENGGSIVRTPKYPLEDNIRSSNIKVVIDEAGNAYVDFKNIYSGLEYEYNNINHYAALGNDQQKKWIEKTINIPSFSIENFEFVNNKVNKPNTELNAKLLVNKLVSHSGSRFFLQPNLMNRNTFIPNKDDFREQPIYVKDGFWEFDTIKFILPQQHVVEAFFEPVKIVSEFGEYCAEIKKESDGTILYLRSYKQFDGLFPNNRYEDFSNFHKQVVRADKKRISFLKKT